MLKALKYDNIIMYIFSESGSFFVPKEFIAVAFDSGGGTVIHSRSIGSEEASSVWGLGLQEEKDMVLILAETESKVNIMKSIGERCGVSSKANGTVVSLPIDSVMGI